MRLKIYVIARVSKDVHAWNKSVCDALDPSIEVFLPQEHNPWNMPHQRIPQNVYDTDKAAMDAAHVGLLLPEYGTDCAFEVGYHAGTGKPVVAYVDTQVRWLRDWMVKGGVTHVTTTNPETFALLKDDPILSNARCIKLETLGNLSGVIRQAYDERHQ